MQYGWVETSAWDFVHRYSNIFSTQYFHQRSKPQPHLTIYCMSFHTKSLKQFQHSNKTVVCHFCLRHILIVLKKKRSKKPPVQWPKTVFLCEQKAQNQRKMFCLFFYRKILEHVWTRPERHQGDTRKVSQVKFQDSKVISTTIEAII